MKLVPALSLYDATPYGTLLSLSKYAHRPQLRLCTAGAKIFPKTESVHK